MPRLTSSAFRDLALWMLGLGFVTGVTFPPFSLALGLPASSVMTPVFVGACIGAGLLVGGANYGLARFVVGRRIRLLAGRMETVRNTLQLAAYTGDWSGCSPEQCAVPVDSTDEFGETARSFNDLVTALAAAHQVEGAVRDFSAMLATHLELDAVCRNAIRQLLTLTGAQAGAILVEADGAIEIGASVRIRDVEQLAQADVVRAALRGEATVELDAPSELMIDAAVTLFPARAVLVLPLTFKSVPVGVLVLASTQAVDADAPRLVDLIRPLLAVALNSALAHRRLEKLATLDPLTGLYNRRFGLLRLHEEYSRSIRSKLPLAVAMMDIDHFKSINDTYGHIVGDRVLVRVAQAARRTLREGDVLVRFGGEEFLVLLMSASQEDAARVCERIRRTVAELVVQDGEHNIQVTVSLGAASIPNAPVDNEEHLVRLADEALYAAKAAGRDRVVVA